MKPEDNEKQYEVGYKKPPKKNQFKKGQSGNPKGRPKLIRDFKTDLKVELESTITVQIDGKSKPITKQQALIKKLLSKALNGELGALKTLTNLIALHLKVSEADIDELLDEDVKLFDKYYVERKGGTKNDN